MLVCNHFALFPFRLSQPPCAGTLNLDSHLILFKCMAVQFLKMPYYGQKQSMQHITFFSTTKYFSIQQKGIFNFHNNVGIQVQNWVFEKETQMALVWKMAAFPLNANARPYAPYQEWEKSNPCLAQGCVFQL